MEKIDIISLKDSKNPVSEAYRSIRTNLQFSGVDKKVQIIEITSALPNEGKSTVAANLAIVMALAGKKVLLMDCDFRNPTQHKLFGIHNKGLSNCIVSEGDFHTIIQNVEQENLDILTSGPVAPNPSEILMSNKMQALLDAARTEYDYILLDTPPVLAVTDAAALSTKADGVVLVVSSGEEKPEVLQSAKNALKQAGANLLGGILNKVKVGGGKYGYGYGGHHYGYGYGYGYYYGEKESSSEAQTENRAE